MTLEIIKDTALLTKAIKSIKTTEAKLDGLVHQAAVSCLWQVAEHGNTTPLQTLVDSLSKRNRINALLAWAEQYGAVRYDEKAKQLKFAKGKDTDLEGAIAQPFWLFKPEAAYKPVDLNVLLAQLIKKAEQALATEAEDDTVTKSKIDLDTLAKLKALAIV